MSGGIYVHIPFCKARCSYCSFISDTDLSRQELYVAKLIEEIAEREGFTADTIYIGGGTPSTLYRGALRQITEALYRHNSIAENAEITVEANPESATDAFFDECIAVGVNRISFGLQTTSDRLLRNIGRIHTFDRFLQAYERAKKEALRISVDLMLGIPEQKCQDALDSVRKICALDPGHISLYALTVEEGTPLHQSGFCPNEDEEAEFYEACWRYLISSGYQRYEVSNFSREGQESRHNRKYWTMAPYLGLGVAAHSFDGRTRRANTNNLSAYIAGINNYNEVCETDAELREEFIMLALRTREGIDLTRYTELFGNNLLTERQDSIERMIRLNFLKQEDGRLCLTDNAYYVMNSVITALL